MIKKNVVACLWVIIFALLCAHQIWIFCVEQVRPDTDILALLPDENRNPTLEKAFSGIVNSSEQKLIVLVKAKDWEQTLNVANIYRRCLGDEPNLFKESLNTDLSQSQLKAFFAQYQSALLTPKMRKALQEQTANDWVNTAMQALYSPFSSGQVVSWQEDPFGLFNDWALDRIGETRIRVRDDALFVPSENGDYAVLLFTLEKTAFAIQTQSEVVRVLTKAKEEALSLDANTHILTGGVVLHAAHAGQMAQKEVSIIGTCSLVCIALLIWFTFRSLKPILLVAISLATGIASAISICYLVFGQIHLMTLVFGASLIGLAQDYGIYYLCNRLFGDGDKSQVLKKLIVSLVLTLCTTVCAYIGLIFAPFPGLRQMALFAIVGLVFAWGTVVALFPFLTRNDVAKPLTCWPRYRALITHWPYFGKNKFTAVVGVVLILAVVVNVFCMHANDDIRLLQKPEETLVSEQLKINQLLDLPQMGAFFLVKGTTDEQVLTSEEKLKESLETLKATGKITGYSAISNWVPSLQLQKINRALIEDKLMYPGGPYDTLQSMTGLVSTMSKDTQSLTVDDFLKTATGEGLSYLWVKTNTGQQASVVTVRGLKYDDWQEMQQVARQYSDVIWVDRIAEISRVMGQYRLWISMFVCVAYLVSGVVLSLRYRWRSLAILATPAIASVVTLGILSAVRVPINIFTILALMLVLGVGVDSGIFFAEHGKAQPQSVWLETGLSVFSTILAFGLLALSSMPALRSFGMTMLLGMLFVWMIAPCFRALSKDI